MVDTAQGGGSAPRTAKDSRHRARELAVQMLYQSEVGRIPMREVH